MTLKLTRFDALIECLRDGSPRPARQSAAFTAVALVHCDADEATLAASTRVAYQEPETRQANS